MFPKSIGIMRSSNASTPTTLKTILVPFDLGKLVLQHDASQNLELQPGDVISIFSEADIRVPIEQQTKLIRLEGEFVHAGLYTVLPGETLRHLVERAGGLTPNAYLFGSEFTRESTRLVQQARLDEYIQNLDMRMQRSNLALAASGGGGAPDVRGVHTRKTVSATWWSGCGNSAPRDASCSSSNRTPRALRVCPT